MIPRSALAVIVRAELRAWRNRVSRSNPARVVGLAIFGLLAATVIGGSLFAVAVAAGHLLPSARDAILAGAFTALSVLMLVVGFPTVIATYFAGRDLMQLILAPVRTGEIFLARSLFAMSANLLVAAVFLTFVAGVGAGSGASPLFYVLAVMLVVLQVLLVTSLQATFMAAVLRWVPARLARDVAIAVAGFTGAGAYLAWNITVRRSFATRARPDVGGIVSTLQRIEWLPSAWPGHALSSLIAGDAGATLAWTAATLLLAGALVACSVFLYERTLLAGLGLLGGVPTSRARTKRPDRVASRGAASPVLAIVRKDWITYRRDIRRLSRLLPGAIFLVAYAFVIRPPRGVSSIWGGVFVVGFAVLFLSLLLAGPAIPGERRGFLLLRLAPITYAQLIRAKVLFTGVPVLAIAMSIGIGSAIVGGNGVGDILQVAVLAAWWGVGSVCIGVSAGAIDPKFEAADDRRAIGVTGTFTALGADVAFALCSVGAFALLRFAPAIGAGTSPIDGLPPEPALAAAMVVVAIILAAAGAALVAAVLRGAVSRLRSFEGSITIA
ncbi:MAG TPA: hypothetical protein VGT01_03010 [Candidatus Dormibacteraeota bacterium]|nr:hypothetical protein [Candidatus Dormibacteraeota bacterium]